MERSSFKSERIAHLVISLVSILVMFSSLSYGLGTARKPGPGLYPFVVGLLILPLSLSLFIASLKGGDKGPILNRAEIKIK